MHRACRPVGGLSFSRRTCPSPQLGVQELRCPREHIPHPQATRASLSHRNTPNYTHISSSYQISHQVPHPLFSSTHTSCRWLLPACSCSPPWRLSLWGACQVLARTPTRAPEPAMVAAKNQSVRQGITAHLNQLTHNKTASASSRILLTPTIPFGHRAPILEVITRMLITYSSGFRPNVILCQTAIAQSALAATADTLLQHTLTAALLPKHAAVSQMGVS